MTAGQFASAAANYKKTRGIASDNHRNEYIGMFEIRKNSTNNMWYLKVNEDRLIGTKYSSKNEALAVLHGLFSGMNAKTDGMNAIITKMISQGRGIIEADTGAAVVNDAIIWMVVTETSAGSNMMRVSETNNDDEIRWFRNGSTTPQTFTTDGGSSGWIELDDGTQNYMETNGSDGVKVSADFANLTTRNLAKAEWAALSDANKVLILKQVSTGEVTEWDFSDGDHSAEGTDRFRLDISSNSTQTAAIHAYVEGKWTGTGKWYVQLGKNAF